MIDSLALKKHVCDVLRCR